MAVRTGMTFSGGADLAANLTLLQDKVRKKVMRSAAVAGAAVVKKRAKEIAKSKGINDTGATIRNIAGKVEKSSNPDYVQINIGVRHGRPKKGAKNQDDPFYWHFNEFGTSKQAARPFMRPAFEESKEKVLEVVAEKLRAGIEKFKE